MHRKTEREKRMCCYRIVLFTEGLMFLSVTANVTQLMGNWDPKSQQQETSGFFCSFFGLC